MLSGGPNTYTSPLALLTSQRFAQDALGQFRFPLERRVKYSKSYPLIRSPSALVFSASELVQRSGTLLEPLLSADPELFPVLHDVGEDGTAEEDHVFPAWRVFDADLEFLETRSKS